MSKKRPASTQQYSNKRARRDSLPLNHAAQPLRVGHIVTVLVHGSPDFGQLGLGMDIIDEVTRPRLHKKIQELQERGQLGKHGVEQIVAGGMHSLLVDSEGKELLRVWSWGVNDSMALGRPTQGVEGVDSEELESSPAVISSLHGFRAVRVAACDSYSMALDETGTIRAWGTFKLPDGQCTFDGTEDLPKIVLEPTSLPTLANVEICQLACGENHVLALTRTGFVYTWGDGTCHQLGRKVTDHPWEVAMKPERLELRNIVTLGAGYRHSFAVDNTGTVYGWGLNKSCQLGLGSQAGMDYVLYPTPIPALDPAKHNGNKVVAIAAGEFHSLFLFNNGEVWSCGQSDQFAVGLAHDRPEYLAAKHAAESSAGGQDVQIDICIPEPVRVAFPPPPTEEDPTPTLPPADTPFSSTRISHISADARYSFACSDQGVLYSWGAGESAQLGLGGPSSAETPTRVQSKYFRMNYRPIGMSCGGQVVLVIAAIPA
ncbi:hypothetical protein D9758_008006 [Tetrapyrgos nigripes]|uniref:RCC1-like domain-containing protein n=1 Tax=Tetrapyrgos nigripes TaxID=182062 RepID=A0A8H5FVH6_9AGAR|nr:hypothetical protein D9758_008006 [Tetrapyrgos nigripes]